MLSRSDYSIEKNKYGDEDKKGVSHEKDKTVLRFDDGYISFNEQARQFYYVIKAPPIRNLVFSGGGSRGILYSGVIDAFAEFRLPKAALDQTFLSQIETVAGSSVGSIFAASIAAGITPQELLENVVLQDLQKLLGSGYGLIKHSGDPLYQLLKETIVSTMTKRLMENSRAWGAESQITLEGLYNELKRESPIITFSMLKTLTQLNGFLFKELYITAVCVETGDVCYFSADFSPDLEIASACRASIAVPIIITPAEIHKKFINKYRDNKTLPDILHFVDGGYLDNIPFSAVEERQEKVLGINVGDYRQNLQTLIILFDDSIAADDYHIENSFYIQSPFLNARGLIKHELAPKTALDFIYDTIPKTFGGIKSTVKYTEKRERDYEQVRYAYSQRNIPLKAGFTSGNFKKAKKNGQLAINRAKLSTLAYLENHAEECIHYTFTDLNDLIYHLPPSLFTLLLENRQDIPCLNNISLREIKKIRRQKSISVIRHHSAFDIFFQSLLSKTQYIFNAPHLIKSLIKHFQLIKNDYDASAHEKMIRALFVALNFYPSLTKSDENKQVTSLFDKKFKEYISAYGAPLSHPHIDFNHEHFCTEKKAKNIFANMHVFYGKFQRIMFILDASPSSFIDPEDTFRRKYIEIIINELRDIASSSLLEPDKLRKMEDYLFASYHKIIFHQKSLHGALARSLKYIIESREGLNITHQYAGKSPARLRTDTMSLLMQLAAIKPLPPQKKIIELLINELHAFLYAYSKDSEVNGKRQLMNIVNQAYRSILTMETESHCYSFFKQPSELSKLLKPFTIVHKMTTKAIKPNKAVGNPYLI